MSDKPLQQALAVKRRYEDELMGKANVVAVGVGLRVRAGLTTAEVCIVVSVTHKVPAARLAARDRIPEQLDGVPLDVQATGVIQAL